MEVGVSEGVDVLSLCRLPRKETKNSLGPVDPTPLDDLLDDWLQAPESSENWDKGQKEAQVVSFAKNLWNREKDGV